MTPLTKHRLALRRPTRRVQDTPRTQASGADGEDGAEEPDEYEHGSFICSDDESIVYASQTSASGGALDSSQW